MSEIGADTSPALDSAITEQNTPSYDIPEKFGGDVNKLVESYSHLESKLGSMYSVPNEDSSPEKWNEFDQRVTSTGRYIRTPNSDDPAALESFYNSLGRPESPDKYTFSFDDDIKEYVDPNLVNSYSQVAHQAGLTTQQAQALVDFEVARGKQQLEAMENQRIQAENQLRQTWGPDYDNRLAGAKAAARSYSEKYPDAVERLMNGPEGNNPVLISMLSELGANMREQGHAGLSNAPQYGMSSEEAMDQIRNILDNKSHAYYDSSNPGHQHAVEKVKKLYGIAYPER